MNKIYTLIILIFTSSFILVSCSGSKSMYKKGLKLEQAGMYSESSSFYYEALKRDITNIDASIRLKKVGEIVLNEKFENFENSINKGNKKGAILEYHSAKRFIEKLQAVNINLKISDEHTFYFNQAKEQYINDRLNKVNTLISEEKFIEAKKLLDDIVKIDPDNQEIRDLIGFTIAEPIYIKAMYNFEVGKFRNAYYEFDKVLNYKDSREMKALAKEKAIFVVIVKPIKNTSDYYDLDEKLTIKVEQLFSDNKNPFLKIIESGKYERLISEKKLSKEDNWQNHANNILEADAFLSVSIIDVSISNGKLIEKRMKGWVLSTKKRKDKETGEVSYIKDFSKVYYYEYSRKKSVHLGINYQLKSFNSNEILINKFEDFRESDRILFADFDGDKNDLRSGYWKSRNEKNNKDVVEGSSALINDLRNKLSARRTIRTTNSMENEIIDKLANSIVFGIDKYTSNKK